MRKVGKFLLSLCAGLLASMLNGVLTASLASSAAELNSTLSGYAIATTTDPSYAVAYEFYNNLEAGPHPLVPDSEPAVYVKVRSVADPANALAILDCVCKLNSESLSPPQLQQLQNAQD